MPVLRPGASPHEILAKYHEIRPNTLQRLNEAARIPGMSGPAPTPTSVRVLEGNPSHRPLRTIPVATGIPVKPSWLKGDAGALWKSLVPELQHAGLVGKVDEVALTVLCQTWAASLAVDRELTDPDKADDPRLQRRAGQLRASLLAYCTAFGLTPASRTRLAPPAPPRDDTMGGLLS